MKHTTYFFALIITFGLLLSSINQAFSQMHGKVQYFNATTLNIQYLYGQKPTIGQRLTIKRKFKMGRMQGTSSLAEGSVSKIMGRIIIVQVTKYTSTMVKNGVKKPLVKIGSGVIASWQGAKTNKSTTSNAGTGVSERGTFKEAVQLIKRRKHKQALPILDALIAKDNNNYAYYYERGIAYLKTYKYKAAAQDFTQTIKLRPQAQMAYFHRAEAYSRSYRTREKALEDYNYLLSQDLKNNEQVLVLKKVIKLKDRMKDLDGACNATKKIQKLEGKNLANQDLYNKYCVGIKVAKKPSTRSQLRCISQSTNGYEVIAEMIPETENCHFYKKENINFTQELLTNGYVQIANCKPKYRSSYAIVKIKSRQGKRYVLEIMYWTNSINGKPWVKRFKTGQIISVSW